MNEKHDQQKRYVKLVRRLMAIFCANILCVIAFNGFFIPANLLSGGVGGVAIITQYLSGVSAGIVVFLINIPIFILAARKVDRDFAVYSFISMVMFSVLLVTTAELADYVPLDDTILQALFGGVINGAGMGLLFRNRSSQGGLDIIAALLKLTYNFRLGSALLMLNTVIVALASLLFGLEKGLYTMVSMFVAYQVLDQVQIGFSCKKTAFIVTGRPEEISAEILKRLKRGVTFIDGMGAYTKQEKRILYCVVDSKEVVVLKNIITGLDPQAFTTITDVVEVKGRGFKKIGI